MLSWVLTAFSAIVGLLLIPGLLSWIRVNNARAKQIEAELEEFNSIPDSD